MPSALIPALTGVLRGLRDLRQYVRASVIGTLLPVLAVAIGAGLGAERGAAIGFIVGQLLAGVIMMLYAVRISKRQGIPIEIRAPKTKLRELALSLVGLGLLALAAASAGAFGQNLVRAEIVAGIGLGAVGLFAGAWSISNRLPLLIYKTMTGYVLPEISALREDWQQITQVQNDTVRISLLVATPALALATAAASVDHIAAVDGRVPAGR